MKLTDSKLMNLFIDKIEPRKVMFRCSLCFISLNSLRIRVAPSYNSFKYKEKYVFWTIYFL